MLQFFTKKKKEKGSGIGASPPKRKKNLFLDHKRAVELEGQVEHKVDGPGQEHEHEGLRDFACRQLGPSQHIARKLPHEREQKQQERTHALDLAHKRLEESESELVLGVHY